MFIIAEGDSEPTYSFVSCLDSLVSCIARLQRLQKYYAFSDVRTRETANMEAEVSNRPEIRCLFAVTLAYRLRSI